MISPPTEPNIYLIGFMAAGKTTVGGELASLLHRPFVDLDREIERHAGRSIAELFEQSGEEFFRGLESDLLIEIASRKGQIVALGGGAFAELRNRSRVRETGIAVWLDVPFEVLLDRLRNDRGRPLNSPPAQLALLYEARCAHYRTADLSVELSEGDARASALKIVQGLELYSGWRVRNHGDSMRPG